MKYSWFCSVPGTDVIRTPGPQPFNNKPALNNQMAPYPDEKVGHDPGSYDPYSGGPYDLESPPYSEYDDVDDVSFSQFSIGCFYILNSLQCAKAFQLEMKLAITKTDLHKLSAFHVSKLWENFWKLFVLDDIFEVLGCCLFVQLKNGAVLQGICRYNYLWIYTTHHHKHCTIVLVVLTIGYTSFLLNPGMCTTSRLCSSIITIFFY